MPVTVIRDAMIPRGRVDRPGTPIIATTVTIHNTDNSHPGANANAHARALVTGSLLGEYLRSWHFTVDDVEIYRHIPIDEKAYHAGPTANASSIGVEICQNPDQNERLAYENAAWLAATLLHKIKATPNTGLRQHHDWTGKNCPGVIRGRRGAWEAFVADVTVAFAKLSNVGGLVSIRPRAVNFTSNNPEAAAAKLNAALASPIIRSIIQSEFLHAAGGSEIEASASSWLPKHLKAQYERAKSNGWIQPFKDEAKRRGFSPAVIMAIASRETNMRNIIGDSGHGYGIMQIDDRSFPDWVNSGAWRDANLGIAKGALVLGDKRNQVEEGRGKKLKFGSSSFVGAVFNRDQLLRITIAAYNSGLKAYYHFSTSGNPDQGTTGRDYSVDVLNRAKYFDAFLGLSGNLKMPRRQLTSSAERILEAISESADVGNLDHVYELWLGDAIGDFGENTLTSITQESVVSWLKIFSKVSSIAIQSAAPAITMEIYLKYEDLFVKALNELSPYELFAVEDFVSAIQDQGMTFTQMEATTVAAKSAGESDAATNYLPVLAKFKIDQEYKDTRVTRYTGTLVVSDVEGNVVGRFNATTGGFVASYRRQYGPTPPGYFVVSHYRPRTERWATRDGVGFTFDLDEVARTGSRSAFRIHPDGSPPGTHGCIGLTENSAGLQDCCRKLRANLAEVQEFRLLVEYGKS
ncbi:N-acetylmuramoyl-L-alanine amidase [Mesorhizobium sp.]|uniref:N-acetylmuramoyl-L-alanine amidase n=2 Tax=Mesorhizobium sp. TaxID=1871066 RepID=UPI000FE3025D|nr:MAG: hypothetical protein EOQ84_32030 [Mesorhizobium sp.]RWL20150.1 MAG: hypothetical protein EOR58_31620 [Mesorhizobium sp.]RWL23582.1 MAG: hypothetical protein EOR63_31810 [Mesorhizobium sp.]RWL27679.1 MAG: hypothetical protein EOR59_31855 [Mesorhizobium sp.]RWL46028.1 MAG: hypothetical protein EOR62_30045 [Mesorhizobium sp.]